MLKQRLILGACVVLLIGGLVWFSYWPGPRDVPPAAPSALARGNEGAAPPGDRAQRERQLAQALSGATLTGFMGRNHKGRIEAVSPDAGYRLGKVEKNPASGLWKFDYFVPGTDDLFDMPPLTIEWAGDTPVLVLTGIRIKGKPGKFSAQILIDGDQYSGTWSDGTSRGCMFGTIAQNRERST